MADARAEFARLRGAYLSEWGRSDLKVEWLNKLLEAHAAMVRAETIMRIDQWKDAMPEAERRLKNG